jgi:hypothetical protein
MRKAMLKRAANESVPAESLRSMSATIAEAVGEHQGSGSAYMTFVAAFVDHPTKAATKVRKNSRCEGACVTPVTDLLREMLRRNPGLANSLLPRLFTNHVLGRFILTQPQE